MISFKSRNPAIINADRITRAVNSVYPHISESKSKVFINEKLLYMDFDSKLSAKLRELKIKNAVKLTALQFKMTSGMELFKNIILALKNHKIGNCYESARLAEIIAKINGQENIYPMKMFIARNCSGADLELGHVVSVITNKQIESKEKYTLKNKDAIIIDPWLGITEFAGKYLEKLRHDFGYHFEYMPDSSFSMNLIARNTKNLKEFNKQKKELFKPVIKFLLHEDDRVTKSNADELRQLYPELMLKDYENVNLSTKQILK